MDLERLHYITLHYITLQHDNGYTVLQLVFSEHATELALVTHASLYATVINMFAK